MKRQIQEDLKGVTIYETIANARRKCESKRNVNSNLALPVFSPVASPDFAKNYITKISFQNAKLKDDVMSMEAPIFSLSKTPDTEIRTWTSKNGKSSITLIPSVLGSPNMYDKDILIYVFSCLIMLKNSGIPISRTLEFHGHDYFTAKGKSTGGDAYDALEKTLDRLNGFLIKTNIKTNKILITEPFRLIENYKLIKYANTNKTELVRITLSEWLYNALEAFEVLTIDSGYFSLTPSEKRLYEIARKHVGNKKKWDISCDLLITKVFNKTKVDTETKKEFNRMLRKAIASDKIPSYRLRLVDSGVQFYQKDIKKLLEV